MSLIHLDAPPTRTFPSATTSACSAASSATRCGSRRGRRPSTSSSASARPRSASTATRTRGPARELADDPEQPVARAAPTRSSAPSAISRISPTSPRTSTTSAAPAPMRWRRLGPAARARSPRALKPCRGGGHQPGRARGLLRAPRWSAGADRAPDRGAPQEHHRPRDGGGATPGRARPQRLTPEEEAANKEALRRAILTLWQTSILRRNRLKVIDEVTNGLSYYDYTFFEELPRFYASLEDQLAAWTRSGTTSSCRRSCAWEAGSAATATAIPS